MKTNYSIKPMTPKLIKSVADTHSESLPNDFLPNLGINFLIQTFYPSALLSNRGKVFVALDEKEVPVGFVLVTLDSGAFLKDIFKTHFLDFVKVGLRSSLSSFKNLFNNIQVICSGLFSHHTQEAGEIFVIAVNNSSRGRGIGKLLVQRSIKYLKEKDIDTIRIKTLASNLEWIEFFKKNRWEVEKEFQLIGNKYISLYTHIK